MKSLKQIKKSNDVGGHTVERLSLGALEKKYNISRNELLNITDEVLSVVESRQDKAKSFPVSVLNSEALSGLEAIVKFLREERNLPYLQIGVLLNRNHKTLAVTYRVAKRKMHERFSSQIEDDATRIPFSAFSNDLSVLEAICTYLKSHGNTYVDIARMIGKDPRTVWTVCKRAEKKSRYKDKYDG